MAEKLRSILKRIHWYLALKAAVFAIAWAWFPFWVFLLIALYLYLERLFQTRPLAVPFLALIILCYIQSPSATYAVIFGGVFYFILLIKNLILIDRRSAYELVVLTLTFLLVHDFYAAWNGGVAGAALAYALLAAVLFGLLVRSFIRFFRNDLVVGGGAARAAVMLMTLLLWQTLIAGLFLPIDFTYQTVAVFLVAVLLIDLVPQYLVGMITRAKVFTAASVVFTLFVIVLGSARWGL